MNGESLRARSNLYVAYRVGAVYDPHENRRRRRRLLPFLSGYTSRRRGQRSGHGRGRRGQVSGRRLLMRPIDRIRC